MLCFHSFSIFVFFHPPPLAPPPPRRLPFSCIKNQNHGCHGCCHFIQLPKNEESTKQSPLILTPKFVSVLYICINITLKSFQKDGIDSAGLEITLDSRLWKSLMRHYFVCKRSFFTLIIVTFNEIANSK